MIKKLSSVIFTFSEKLKAFRSFSVFGNKVPNRVKRYKVIVLAVALFVLLPETIAAAAQYPDTVRIGLKSFGNSVSSVSVSAVKGIEIGFHNNNAFILLIDQKDSQPLVIRKDSYFVRTGQGQVIEYSPTEGVPYEGEIIGPWHIKIGDNAPDFMTAQSLVEVLMKSEIKAYVAYENGWQVWTGFYTDQKSAEARVSQLKEILNTVNISVIPETSQRLAIYDTSFNILMVYGGTNGYMQVYPKQENNPNVMFINGKRYRGYLEIRRYSDSDLTLINVLDIEKYLYGVVPYEIEPDAPMEAIKAQAVAARTYAYRNIGTSVYQKWGFDMLDTVESQVYKGYDGERTATSQAVDETKGKKMLYIGKLAQVFYFASSGGMTANVKEVWGGEIEYLLSVPDPYESETSYNYIWEKVLTGEEIKKILFISNVEIGDILSVSAEEYSPSGRVTKLRITGTQGSITYYNEDTRTIFNLNSQKYTIQSAGNVVVKAADGSLKTLALDGRYVASAGGIGTLSAANITLSVVGADNKVQKANMSSDKYVFNGKGWGHGVGMSQEGAKGFARNGYNYEQILKHYFTGITVE
ncbi:MAG: SpoIID/LytB domain-containing protein [Clostridiaceae bacterium]|nr:SpoIID/LytB domain-containing protein [Clostridiaceae bacterium]